MSTATSASRWFSPSSAIVAMTSCACRASSGRSPDAVVGQLDVVERLRARPRAPRGGAALTHEGVAQRLHQVGELVLAAQEARPGEHPHVGFLHEILGVLRGTAQRPGGPVETIEVLGQRLGVEPAHLRSTVAPSRADVGWRSRGKVTQMRGV